MCDNNNTIYKIYNNNSVHIILYTRLPFVVYQFVLVWYIYWFRNNTTATSLAKVKYETSILCKSFFHLARDASVYGRRRAVARKDDRDCSFPTPPLLTTPRIILRQAIRAPRS